MNLQIKKQSNKNRKRLLVGLDLGQQNDFTVLSCIVASRPADSLHNRSIKQRNTYLIPFIYRAPLNIAYPAIVSWIHGLVQNYFKDYDYTCVVDYTGVGRPIVDLLRQQDIKVVAVNTTGGYNTTWKNNREVNVPKKDVIASLRATLEGNRIRIADNIISYDDTIKEFVNFQEKISNSINLQYEAKYGYHDDIVMSVGLAIWYGENKIVQKKKIRIVTWN